MFLIHMFLYAGFYCSEILSDRIAENSASYRDRQHGAKTLIMLIPPIYSGSGSGSGSGRGRACGHC